MAERKFPVIMKSIAAVTTVCTFILLLMLRYLRASWILTAAISVGTTAYHFLMRLAVGYLVPKVTGYHFNHQHPWFQSRKWEHALYRKLNLKMWKKHLPTYAPSQFSLKSNTPLEIVRNMCGAEIVHEIIMALSFLPLGMVPLFGAFPVFLITSLLAALVDSIFVMTQRFNRPRIIRILEKQEAQIP